MKRLFNYSLFILPTLVVSTTSSALAFVGITHEDSISPAHKDTLADIVTTTSDDALHSMTGVATNATEHMIASASDVVASHQATETSSAGFPQLDVTTFSSQIFWIIIFFILLYTLMSRIALPRIGEILDNRRTTREQDLSRAEEIQKEVTEVKDAYGLKLSKAHDNARDLLTSLDVDLSKKAANQNSEFTDEARQRLIKAEKAIEAAKEEALESIADVATDIAAEAAGKITQIMISKSRAKQAVQDVLKEAK